ncbi:MAG: DUF1294 domain-containing protein [Kiritimatiellae bacterium]|nr:DUF1294 domain-containing protein [Kiritimatiellia bacterium]MBP5225971.1 DUF1294 domain-containing protein [Kiritimatiellia bacterium]
MTISTIGWLSAVYGVMSVVTFCAYAWDKRAAQKGRWRTRERSLHLLELFFGWPGALLAQRLIRHKSRKLSFRVVFWLMVIINVAVVGYWLFRRG